MVPALVLLAALLLAAPAGAPPPCAGRGSAVLVLTAPHELHLCLNGLVVKSFPVELGRGGVGKTRQGDEKVPLGTYPLGRGRPSTYFHTYIPVDYPTAAQRRAGYTGGTIGIHGPLQIPPGTDLARPTGDWTLGCIALPTESAVDEVARWARAEGVARIIIE
jgi:hypothetical protein